MKFPLNPLLALWIVANVGTLVTIGSAYFLGWTMAAQRLPSTETVQKVTQSVSHDQLIQLYMGQDAAVRGELKALFATLYCWLGLTILNIVIVSLYMWFGRESKR